MKKILGMVAVLLMVSASPVLGACYPANTNPPCKGNFDYDCDVMQSDIADFKANMGRWSGYNPCPPDGPAPVPKTGQTTSYATGDDGYYKKGVTWPNPRFTDNGDGTVTDNLTGLIWLKDANCATFGALENWYDALSDCNQLAAGSCGLTDGSSIGDWRLPNLFEMQSLRDMNHNHPALSNTAGSGKWTPGDPFLNVPYSPSGYWTSTIYNAWPDAAWYVDMAYGGEDASDRALTANYVWPVRGGH